VFAVPASLRETLVGQYLQNKFNGNSKLAECNKKTQKPFLFGVAQNYPQINNKRKTSKALQHDKSLRT
jgi:hypothetical protein